ncbi:MAG: calcium/sodium antiporter [Lachnospiraceae bacterium]|nr:calcium/sodium antiporter [Lachnospiraceae bacterium]
MVYVFLIVGFILLIKGADFFVEGSSSVAKMLRVPSLIIGMTIVAMGTSFPECSVSINASLAGSNALAISNAVGSNIFNLMVVCGVCALFCPLAVDKGTLKKEFPFSIIVALILLGLGSAGMVLGRVDGIIMSVIFAGFLYWMVVSARKARAESRDSEEEYEIMPVWKCILYIIGGIVAIIAGGDVVVDSATKIAEQFGMSENLIGLTVVAFGTSLPELVTSVVAAKKNEVDMALGNVIGSNIFNILLVLGVAAAISPIAFIMENIIDIIVLVVMSIIVWIFAWSKQKLVRSEGIVMLLMYAVYVVYICKR